MKLRKQMIIGNNYRVIRHLGHGGVGSVLLVDSIRDNRRYALKYLSVQSGEQIFNPDLDSEFRIMKSFDHPHIVRIIDYDHDRQLGNFLVMEYVNGQDIRKYFSDMDVVPSRIYQATYQILDALSYIHKAGIIHGDLKPGNILVSGDATGKSFTVKLADFGLVTYLSNPHGPQGNLLIRGSAEFMPPEMLLGRSVDIRGDIYSLGVTLYYLITGEFPFTGNDLRTLLLNILGTSPSMRGITARGYPKQFTDMLMRMMVKEPGLRPSSSEEVLGMIAGYSSREGGSTLPSSASPIYLYTPPLIGHKALRKNFLDKIRNLEKGKSGVFFITGAEGYGKTRILHELKTFALAKGLPVLHLKFPEKPVEALLLKQLTGVDHSGSRFKTLNPTGQQNFDTGPLFRNFFYAFFKDNNVEPESFWHEHRVILLDDIHQIDLVSLECARYLLEISGHHPLILACAFDPGEKSRLTSTGNALEELVKHPESRRVPLKPFSVDLINEMIGSVLNTRDVSDTIIQHVKNASEGNPAHILEIMRYLHENELLEKDGAFITLNMKHGNTLPLPENIHSLFRQRWELLAPYHRHILALVSLPGIPVASSWVLAMDSAKKNAVSGILRELIAGRFLKATSTARDKYLEPVHDLYRRFSMSSLSAREKNLLYQKCSDTLMEFTEVYPAADLAPVLSLCMLASGNFRESIPWFGIAGDSHIRNARYDKAAKSFQRGLRLCLITGNSEEAVRLASRLAGVFQKHGYREESIRLLVNLFQDVFIHLSNPENAPMTEELALSLSEIYQRKADYQEARKILLTGFRMFPRNRDPVRYFRFLVQLGWLLFRLNRPRSALAVLEKARCHEGAEHYSDGLMETLNHIAMIHEQKGNLDYAEKIYRTGIEYFSGHENLSYIARCHGNLGIILYRKGYFEDSAIQYQKAIEYADKAQDPNLVANSHNNMGWSYFNLGNWQEAEKHFLKSLELQQKLGQESKTLTTLSNLGTVSMKLGNFKVAENYFQESIRLAKKCDDSLQLGLGYRRLGMLYAHREQFQEGLRNIRQGYRLSRKHNHPYGIAMSYHNLAETFFWKNDYASAWKNIQKAYRTFQKTGSADGIISSMNIRALLRLKTGDMENIDDELTSIKAALAKTPQQWEEAKYLKVKAIHQALINRTDDSMKLFQEAIRRFQKLNDTRELGFTYIELVTHLAGSLDPDTRNQYLNWAHEIFTALNMKKSAGMVSAMKNTPVPGNKPVNTDHRASIQERINVLYKVSSILASFHHLDNLLENILAISVELFNADRGALLQYNSISEKLEVAASINIDRSSLLEIKRISSSVVERVLVDGSALYSNDALHDDRFRHRSSIITHNILSLLCVPLIVQSKTIGVLYLDSIEKKHLFRGEDVKLMEIFASMVSLAIDNAREFKELKKDKQTLANEIKQTYTFDEKIIGNSPEMKQVFELLKKLLNSDVTVLIEGESGTGKELIARYIHYHGKRYSKPFVVLNCADIPVHLAESTLFGHRKGSFTGAVSNRTGLLKEADTGTLFIDELPDLLPETQVKLLRFLEEKTFKPLGSNNDILVNVRIIAATNRNLETEVQNGTFRQDLFYRLNVVKLSLPPLRNRHEDIPALINYLLKRRGLYPDSYTFPRETMELLQQYPWPGNIRQLRNEIDRIFSLHKPPVITPDLLSETIRSQTLPSITPTSSTDFKESKKELERKLIHETLIKCRGNRSKTARTLGISRPSLLKKIREYHLDDLSYL